MLSATHIGLTATPKETNEVSNIEYFGEPTKEIWYWEHKLPEGVKAYNKTKPIQKNEFDGLKQWWNKRKESEQAWKVPIKTLETNGFNLDTDVTQYYLTLRRGSINYALLVL